MGKFELIYEKVKEINIINTEIIKLFFSFSFEELKIIYQFICESLLHMNLENISIPTIALTDEQFSDLIGHREYCNYVNMIQSKPIERSLLLIKIKKLANV
ncbi:MAG: hypothetical protein HeimC3_39170, partial [Candidatus Heimdallarchaeota archaeon LC_3]